MSTAAKPSVLIATPAYGGLVTTDYLQSLLSTCDYLKEAGHPYEVFTLKNESLIPRGRNQCAWYALAHGPGGQPFDKLLFVDADMGWKMEDVARLLESDKKVIGGTYPTKAYPITLAANSLEEDREYFGKLRNVAELDALRKARGNERGEIPMMHIPTGFMLIDTSVFVDLIPHVAKYVGMDWSVRARVLQWDFFPIGVLHTPIEEMGMYESEDWAFCSLVRKHLDCGIWLDSHVITRHVGNHTFSAGHM